MQILPLLFVFLAAPPSHAMYCGDIATFSHDISTELEVPLTEKLLQKIDFTGTHAIDAYVSLLTQMPLRDLNAEEQANNRAWHASTFATKMDILRFFDLPLSHRKDAIKQRENQFGIVRIIGFVEPSAELHKEWPGLQPSIEYVSWKDIKNPAEVEFHIRENTAVEDLLRKSFAFRKEYAPEQVAAIHLHVVGSIPWKFLRQHPMLAPIAISESHYRYELAMQFLAIESGDLIVHNAEPTTNLGVLYVRYVNPATVFFSSLSRMGVRTNEIVLRAWAERHSNFGNFKPRAKDRFHGYVSLRLDGPYDDKDLMGFEFRSLTELTSVASQASVVTSARRRLEDQDYGVSISLVRQWAQTQVFAEVTKPLRNAYLKTQYEQPWKILFADAAPDVQKELSLYLKTILRAQGSRQASLKMLVHNWAHTLLAFENPHLAPRIEDAQVQALRRIKGGDAHAVVLQDFIRDSGLKDAVFNWIVK